MGSAAMALLRAIGGGCSCGLLCLGLRRCTSGSLRGDPTTRTACAHGGLSSGQLRCCGLPRVASMFQAPIATGSSIWVSVRKEVGVVSPRHATGVSAGARRCCSCGGCVHRHGLHVGRSLHSMQGLRGRGLARRTGLLLLQHGCRIAGRATPGPTGGACCRRSCRSGSRGCRAHTSCTHSSGLVELRAVEPLVEGARGLEGLLGIFLCGVWSSSRLRGSQRPVGRRDARSPGPYGPRPLWGLRRARRRRRRRHRARPGHRGCAQGAPQRGSSQC
mmetsp:Transcript_84246/g.214466  ORF Transcript_84246/g.214466 Transcript_84246/m.214466 type:complete len:274 (-) Transcript_84246:274-1095(-)